MTLETKRLLLREFQKKDYAAVHSYAGVKENTIYMPWGPNSEKETAETVTQQQRAG